MKLKALGILFLGLISPLVYGQSIPFNINDETIDAPIAVPGEYIVELNKASNKDAFESFLASKTNNEINIANIPNSRLSLVSIPSQERGWVNFNDYLALLEQAPGTRNVQPNFIRNTSRNMVEFNDPMLANQWYLESINAYKAWEVNSDASNIIVAVIDDAVMIHHEDIKGNIWVNRKEIPDNGIDDDNNGYIDDINGWNFGNKNNDPSPVAGCAGKGSGHGTHVAGAIGAVGGNNKGISGVAPKVQIMSLAIGRANNKCRLDSIGILEAVKYAIFNGAKVINLSLGGPMGGKAAEAVYKEATDNNVLLVIAAGNEGLSNNVEDLPTGSTLSIVVLYSKTHKKPIHRVMGPSYPASFSRRNPGIISVANTAMLQNDPHSTKLFGYNLPETIVAYEASKAYVENGKLKIEKFRPSSWQPGSSYGNKSVHIGTPGTKILSAIPDKNNPKISAYKEMTGTSMASPITAGAAALLWSNFPNMTNLEIKQRLLKSVNKNRSLQGSVIAGGSLDLYQALCGKMFSEVAAQCSGENDRSRRRETEHKAEAQPQKSKPKSVQMAPPPKKKPKEQNMNDWLTGEDKKTTSKDKDKKIDW